MADLTKHLVAVCPSMERWQSSTKGSSEAHYHVEYGFLSEKEQEYQGTQRGWTCSCLSFEFRIHGGQGCKHIKAAKEQRCAWNEEMDPGVEPDRTTPTRPRCPNCGQDVIWYEVAV